MYIIYCDLKNNYKIKLTIKTSYKRDIANNIIAKILIKQNLDKQEAQQLKSIFFNKRLI